MSRGLKCAACSNVLANGQNKSGYQVIVKGLSASAEGREPPHAGARERLAVAALSGKLRGVEQRFLTLQHNQTVDNSRYRGWQHLNLINFEPGGPLGILPAAFFMVESAIDPREFLKAGCKRRIALGTEPTARGASLLI